MSFVPTPAMIRARPPTASRTTRSNVSFSASDVVGDSPVVPFMTNASLPASTRCSASAAAPGTSRPPSEVNGVIIAVIIRPNGAGGNADIPATLAGTSDISSDGHRP
ncbi:hypothetical protein FrEUN1fDRAFT_4934, partial [Parafrankia sp. EUN1f]